MPSKEQEVTTLVKPEYQNFTLSDLLRKPTHALFGGYAPVARLIPFTNSPGAPP
jgi:hypothetical protein